MLTWAIALRGVRTNRPPPALVCRPGGKDALERLILESPHGRLEAIRYALTANAIRGLRRTPADKKRAIEVAYTEFPGSTQQEVADLVGCTQARVSQVRPELINAYKLPERTIGKDGRERPTSYNKRNPTPPAEPGEPEQPQQKELEVEKEPQWDAERASMAMKYADMAISQLERIHTGDVKRADALRLVADWIRDN